MISKADKAKELFKQGYNCSQAVFGAFAEDIGLDYETALKISSSFGGGMGRMGEVCGAVTGMLMVAGMKYGYVSVEDASCKAEHYKIVQKLMNDFKDKNGTYICRDLLKSLSEAGKSRSCADFVYEAAEIIENYMNNI